MASTGEVWKLGHRPALDGVRGIAILLVIACHAQIPGMAAAGPVGVTVFFVLSGFLITALLLEEHARAGQVSLRGFYLRRARRLAPALAASTLAIAALGSPLGPKFFKWSDLGPVFGYFGNWTLVSQYNGLGMLGGTWSLAVEEQFYLLWPMMLLAALRWGGPRAVGVVATSGALLSAVARFWMADHGVAVSRLYYGTDMHADALLLGCLLAVALHCSMPRRSLPGGGVAGVALMVLAGFTADGLMAVTWGQLGATAGALGAVYCLARGRPEGGGALSSPFLAWVGRRSYGLYLWHAPVAMILREGWPGMAWPVRLAILLAVSVPLAVLSWRYVERPFMQGGRSGGRVVNGFETKVGVATRHRNDAAIQENGHAAKAAV